MKKIVASLEFGAVYTGAFLALLYTTCIGCLSLSGVLLALSIMERPELFLGVVIFFLAAIGVFIVIIIGRNQLKQIKKWLIDAVPIRAKSVSIGDRLTYSSFIPVTTKKIRVIFKYEGRTIVKESGSNNSNNSILSSLQGYANVFSNYADREIDILYSPQYDQVLLLKREKR